MADGSPLRCVVAGKAELSGVDVAVLNEQQRAMLQKAYAVYNQVLDVLGENADAVAETYNSLSALYEGIVKKTQAIIDKINEGKKISKADQKALEAMQKKSKEMMGNQISFFTN